jgi:hypothetical protein
MNLLALARKERGRSDTRSRMAARAEPWRLKSEFGGAV